MPELNFNLLSPGTELYSGPQVALDPVKAYETAQAKQQSNMLAQLYAKHYDRQTGGVNYNSLIGEAAQNPLTARAIPDIMGEAQKQSQSMAEIAQKRALQQQEEAAAKKYKIETENLYDEQRHKEVNRAVADIAKYANKADAMSGIEKNFEEGKIDQQAYDNLMNMVRNEPSWAKSQGKILQSLLSEKEQLEIQKEEFTRTAPKPTQIDVGGSVKFIDMNPNSATYKQEIKSLTKTATPATEAKYATTVAPKLKQGERWNPTEERVEQVPGSAEYIKQSKLHGTDYGAVQAVNSKTSLADKQIDRLLDPENKDAFNNLFGGYNAYVTQRFTGKTAGLKKDLDSLKQNLKSAGLELIKSGGGGAIGTITEREWPILEGMIESLDPTLPEDDARNKLAEIKAKMENLRAMAADKYETTWGETQYYKGGAAASAPAAPAAGKTGKTRSGVTYTVEPG